MGVYSPEEPRRILAAMDRALERPIGEAAATDVASRRGGERVRGPIPLTGRAGSRSLRGDSHAEFPAPPAAPRAPRGHGPV